VTVQPEPWRAIAEAVVAVLAAWARSKLDLLANPWPPTLRSLPMGERVPPKPPALAAKRLASEAIDVRTKDPAFDPDPRVHNLGAAWEEAIDEDARRELDAYLEWKPWN
jgi:hypothetical protein